MMDLGFHELCRRNNALEEMRDVQATMTNEDRVKLWTILQVGYCIQCGRAIEPQETCECRDVNLNYKRF